MTILQSQQTAKYRRKSGGKVNTTTEYLHKLSILFRWRISNHFLTRLNVYYSACQHF